MTLASQMLSDVTSVFLNSDEHAETVTRTPYNGGAPTSFLAIVDVLETTLDEKSGKQELRRASMMFASSVTINIDDTITYGGVVLIVKTVSLASVGMKTAMLTRSVKRSQQAGEATFK